MKPSPGMRLSSTHAEIGAAVGYEFVGFLEGALVEQKQNTLAGGELAFAMLAFAAFGAAALFGEGVSAVEFQNRIGGGGDGWFGHSDGL